MFRVRSLKKTFAVKHNPVVRLWHPDHLVRAIDDVSFDVREGEVLGLVGESGCGKTTLAKVMLSLYLPTAGSVSYRGQDVHGMNASALRSFRKEVQVIFQDSNSTLDPRMKVQTILEEPLLIHRTGGRKQRREWIKAIMKTVNLSPSFLSRHPSELSGGQRQRLAAARSLLLEPRLIIADEPLSGLDPVVRVQLLQMLLSLKRDFGLTLMLISHDLDTVAYASDRIMVMYRGKIVETINGDAFPSEAMHPYTRLLLGLDQPVSIESAAGEIDIHHHDDGTGCAFRSRCPRASVRCSEQTPAATQVSSEHFVACFLF